MSWDDARTVAASAARLLPALAVPVEQATGLALAHAVVALTALPSFNRAAMDGYAVRGRPPWTVEGDAAVGAPDLTRAPGAELPPGRAREVATGAPVPAGATHVLPYEEATRLGPRVTGRLTERTHIRRVAEECRRGEELIPEATLLTPLAVGLAAAAGNDHVWVRPRPVVTALVTGNELRSTGVPAEGWIRDALGPVLPGLVRWAGGDLAACSHEPDDLPRLTSQIAGARGDLILVCGSTASGPADYLRTAVSALEGTALVRGVACRPGHPQCLFQLPDGRLIVGLPGNPFAAVVAFLTLAAPALAGMQGLAPAEAATVTGLDLHSHPTDTNLVPVALRGGSLRPVSHVGSGMLRGLSEADALAVVAPATSPRPVRLLALPGGIMTGAAACLDLVADLRSDHAQTLDGALGG